MAVIILSHSSKPVSKTKEHGIGYIIQPKKTFKSEFYNCTEENYDKEFYRVFKNRNIKRDDSRTYYHIKQTFAPEDNVSPEDAFEIGKKLAEHYASLGFQTVISTHVDTNNIHNHVIFNSVNRMTFDSYRDNKTNFNDLIGRNDKLMMEYGFLTREKLRNKEYEKKPFGKKDSELQKNGVVLDKETIIRAINKTIENDVKNIFAFIKLINKNEGVSAYFRGETITFSVNGKKYRGATISKEYSLASIKKKIEKTYNEKDRIINLLLDNEKNFKSLEEVFKLCSENKIDVAYLDNDLCFGKGKEQIRLSALFGMNLEAFQNRLQTSSLKNSLKKHIDELCKDKRVNSLDDFIKLLKNKEYIEEISFKNNTLIINTNLGKVDVRSLGYGSDQKNKFSVENIDTKIFIKKTGRAIYKEIRAERITNINDLTRFLEEHQISILHRAGKIFVQYKNKEISINKFINLQKELNKLSLVPFIKALYKVKNMDELKEIEGVIQGTDGELKYRETPISEFVIHNRKLNPEGLDYLFRHNCYEDILRKSKNYDEFLQKIKEENLNYEYNEEIVKIKFEEKELQTIFKDSIKKKTSKEDLMNELEEKGIAIEKDEFNYYFSKSNFKTFHSVSYERIETMIERNRIVQELFENLKTSTSFEEFMRLPGRNLEFKNNALFVDKVNIFKMNFRNIDKEDIFSQENISERMRENHDYVFGTKTSIKYQFKDDFINALKGAKNINDFKEKLSSQGFGYYFEGDDILFKINGKTFNTNRYNYTGTNFFSLSSVEKIIDEKNKRFQDYCDRNLYLNRFFALLGRNEDKLSKNRGLMTSEDARFLRIKREIEEKRH